MLPRTNVPPERAWVITDLGRRAYEDLPICTCRPTLTGIMVSCPDCGTVYGYLKDGLANRPKAQRFSKVN